MKNKVGGGGGGAGQLEWSCGKGQAGEEQSQTRRRQAAKGAALRRNRGRNASGRSVLSIANGPMESRAAALGSTFKCTVLLDENATIQRGHQRQDYGDSQSHGVDRMRRRAIYC